MQRKLLTEKRLRTETFQQSSPLRESHKKETSTPDEYITSYKGKSSSSPATPNADSRQIPQHQMSQRPTTTTSDKQR